MTSGSVATFRCATAAEARSDPRHASAPPARQWFLVEHPGPWARVALAGSGFAPSVVAELSQWANRTGGRVLLVRRPGRPVEAGHRRWFRVDSRAGREQVRGGIAPIDADLIAPLHDDDLGDLVNEPMYLVCTHGKHDVCCALRGRPVAAALAHEFPGRTWECSHLGGDRFAANVVLLPHGLYYAHVSPTAASALVRSYDEGQVAPRLLRGRSSQPAAVQAAEHHLRLATGETRLDAYPVQVVEQVAEDRWTVRFGGPSGPITVTVASRMHPVDQPLTCTGAPGGRYRVFDLVDLTIGASRS